MGLRLSVTMCVFVQSGLQKWAWGQGQYRFLPTLRVLHSSKKQGFFRGAEGVLFCASGVPHVEGFERKALGMDA